MTLRILTIGNITKQLCIRTASGPLPMHLSVRITSGWRTARYEVLFVLLLQIPARVVNRSCSTFHVWVDVEQWFEVSMGESAISA